MSSWFNTLVFMSYITVCRLPASHESCWRASTVLFYELWWYISAAWFSCILSRMLLRSVSVVFSRFDGMLWWPNPDLSLLMCIAFFPWIVHVFLKAWFTELILFGRWRCKLVLVALLFIVIKTSFQMKTSIWINSQLVTLQYSQIFI